MFLQTSPVIAEFALRNASVEPQFGAVASYDLYLPVNDRAFLNLTFSSETSTTGLLICSVFVSNAGDNVPCAADHLCAKKYDAFKSDAWTNASLDFQIIENIASAGATKDNANKVSDPLTLRLALTFVLKDQIEISC